METFTPTANVHAAKKLHVNATSHTVTYFKKIKNIKASTERWPALQSVLFLRTQN